MAAERGSACSESSPDGSGSGRKLRIRDSSSGMESASATGEAGRCICSSALDSAQR